MEHLARHREGLVGLSACLGGEVAEAPEARGPMLPLWEEELAEAARRVAAALVVGG